MAAEASRSSTCTDRRIGIIHMMRSAMSVAAVAVGRRRTRILVTVFVVSFVAVRLHSLF